MNIVDLVYRNSRTRPDRAAFVEIGSVSGQRKEANWREFDNRTNSAANGLLSLEVKKGDRVFLLGKNSLNWLEAYFSIIKTGAWVEPSQLPFY